MNDGRGTSVGAAPGTPAKLLEPQRATTAELQAREEELLELDAKQLDSTRAAAEKWRTGLSGLLAVVTGALFIKGKESVDEIASPWDERLGMLVVLAIVATGYATFRALRAASGQPSATLTKSIEDAGGPRAYRRQLAIAAAADLRAAQVAAFAGMASLTAAVLVTWYAPKPAEELKIQATGGGETICGTSKGVSRGILRIEVAGKNLRTVALPEIDSIEVLKTCP